MAFPAYVHAFLLSLVFTCVVETAVVFILLRFAFQPSIPAKKIVFAGVFASFATIGYVWFVFPALIPKTIFASVWLSEPFVFVVEAVFYRVYLRLSWTESLAVSFAANAMSFLGGRALRVAHMWPVLGS